MWKSRHAWSSCSANYANYCEVNLYRNGSAGLFSLPAIDSCSLILSVIQIYFLHKDFKQKCLLLGVRYSACLLFGGFTAEAFSEPSQTSEMEFFAKIVGCFQRLTIFVKNSISDVWLGFEGIYVVYLQKSHVSTKYWSARSNTYHNITNASFNENRIIFRPCFIHGKPYIARSPLPRYKTFLNKHLA